jgi:DNA processing protein
MEMPSPVDLTPLDPAYPTRLRHMPNPPASLTCRGGPLDAAHAVAIVGSRRALPEAERFARQLAFALAGAGVVVVSGGAQGIDAAAHRGAMEASGRTWAVAGTGCDHCFPMDHAQLFDAIGAGPGAMVWPFPRRSGVRPGAFLARNRVLVALSDAVVVVQAGVPSGALRAAACARKMGKPLWVVPAPPWDLEFRGSHRLLDDGARALTSIDALLDTLDVRRNASATPCEVIPNRMEGQSQGELSDGADRAAARSSPGVEADPQRSIEETVVFRSTSTEPLHLDEIALRSGMSVSTVAPTLLTLALENVVVEGPPGFFRRPKS